CRLGLGFFLDFSLLIRRLRLERFARLSTRQVLVSRDKGEAPAIARVFFSGHSRSGEARKNCMSRGAYRRSSPARPGEADSDKQIHRESIRARYSLPDACKWTDSESFLAVLAKKKGKLLKGGEPDISTAARIVLYDLQRGRLPYYVPPPVDPNAPEEESGDENKGKKRDRENREDEEDGEGGDEGEEGDEEEENGEEESAGPPGKKESSAANAMKRRRQTEAAEAEKDVSEKKKAKTAEAAPGKKTPTGTQTPGPSGKRGTRKAGEKKKTQGMKVVSEADLAKTLVDEFEA
ncbi:putative nucleolar GTP-binding protein 2, partial [Toxoplasma gondii FOU]